MALNNMKFEVGDLVVVPYHRFGLIEAIDEYSITIFWIKEKYRNSYIPNFTFKRIPANTISRILYGK